jgi:hypothetical protein
LLSFGVTFAQVTLTGVMESTYTMDGAKKGLGGGTNGGSEFRLGGVEDLGNGRYEFDVADAKWTPACVLASRGARGGCWEGEMEE